MHKFGLTVVVLTAMALVFGLIAYHFNSTIPYATDSAAAKALQARIAPVGQINSGAVAASPAKAAPTQAAATPKTVTSETANGAEIFQSVCSVCHGSGVAGAPRLEMAAWVDRKAQGVDTLVQHALNGYTGAAGSMPPKGGRPDLSEDQIRATVEWMLAHLK